MMAPDSEQLQEFEQRWSSPPGLRGWLATVNNQPLGLRFMVTSFSFFLIGGVLALLMRVQLTVSENEFLGPQVYNQIFTMHGATMMYLFAVPFIEGLALYLLPMMIGSRDVAFPRLTAFGFWIYLFGGLTFYSSFLFGSVPDVGWFAYTPLSGERYSEQGTDFWLLGLAMVEIAGIVAGIEIVVTVLKMRAPGMSINRLPMFGWAMLVVGLMSIIAFTVLLTATMLLELDRAAGTRFFDGDAGGTNLLWQHLFWFFGHPEVYIIFLPATGIVTMVVSAFARRLAGYTLIVTAIVLTGFLSFGLWVHHMYTTGLPELSMAFFAAASLMIAIASGVQVFAWIASLWGTAPERKTPLLYVLGFLFIFVLGGLTGVMIALVPFDLQVHDTYFIVAHFHYVLIGGAVFPFMAGLYYWLPKITGRLLDDRLGKWSFWLSFLGFNATFFPMHIMGMLGLPRRVYTYPNVLGLDGYNILATVGAFVLAMGILVFLADFFFSWLHGRSAGSNPWNSDSLEWSVSSPPPIYTYRRMPMVRSRHPLWERFSGDPAQEQSDVAGAVPVGDPLGSDRRGGRGAVEFDVEAAAERALTALDTAPTDWRGALCTDAVAARPQAIQYLPGPSLQPFFAAAGLWGAMLGVLTQSYLLALMGGIFAGGALLRWLWPQSDLIERLRGSSLPEQSGLPIFARGSHAVPWWGMLGLVATMATVFATFIYAYFFIRLFSDAWPQGDLPRPALLLPTLTFVLLIASFGSQYLVGRGFAADQRRAVSWGLIGSAILGLLFVLLQIVGLSRLPFDPQENAYASLFYVINIAITTIVVPGLFILAAAWWRTRKEPWDLPGPLPLQLQITSMYWYFVLIAAGAVYAVLYLSPYLL